MTISKKMEGLIAGSSWIRKMFEEGARLKAQHGAERVFDFSIGNPNLPPPPEFDRTLERMAADNAPGVHGYMPNAGYPHVCAAVAAHVSGEQQAEVTAGQVVMTCGAGGGLNVIFKALLDPGDEVIVPRPYFVDYHCYVDNHGGALQTVESREDFSLDLEAVESAIGPRTKAVLINSPHNPSGQVYSEASLAALGDLLRRKSAALGRLLYLVSDEPYRKIVYDGVVVPSIFRAYENSLITTSYSKDLSLPGERIGYVAVNPRAAHAAQLSAGLIVANRILGFINAPALMQRVVAELQGISVDIDAYRRKRDLLCDGLAKIGYRFARPAGAFYLFAQSPLPDDVAFVRALQEELILGVPGSGFGAPGYFRLSYCVDDRVIRNAMPGFRRTLERVV